MSFQDIPKGARIVIAMSGGVDSAVAAAMLTEAGFDCIGVTLRLVPDHPAQTLFEPCCGLEAAGDARRVCEQLGMPHEVLHAVAQFDEAIIAPFVREYQDGRTPNPCIWCNRRIKFGALYARADALGAAHVAMGHFVCREYRNGRFALRRARHRGKDQSYVLAALTQAQLQRAIFPLGEHSKQEVRAYAAARGLAVAARSESQEICFVPDRDYAGFIARRAGAATPGPILNTVGNTLGTHRGLIHYTIGQRRGMGIASERPYYVVRLDPGQNAVIVGHEEECFCAAFSVGEICWGALPPQDQPLSCRVQIRSRHSAAPAQLIPGDTESQVRLVQPQRSVTPGQWAVFYDEDDYVLAAAMITGFTPAPTRSPLP